MMHLIGAAIDTLKFFRQGGNLACQLILARASRVEGLTALTFDQRFTGQKGFKHLDAELPPTELFGVADDPFSRPDRSLSQSPRQI